MMGGCSRKKETVRDREAVREKDGGREKGEGGTKKILTEMPNMEDNS